MDLQQIIDSVDIAEYVSQYIELEDQGGELFGLSPFKDEKSPSFSVTPATNLFYDFAAGFGGSVLTFIQKYHKCSTRQAIDILKKYANITEDYVDTRLSATKTISQFKPKKTKSKQASKHTILSNDIMLKYENDIDKLKTWADEGISYDVMEKYQVRYDPFSNRIVYPIRDLSGNIISVKGRTLNPDWKITLISGRHMRKYTYFQPIGDLDTIFGYYEHMQEFKHKNEIVLFEGEKSVMIMDSWGIKNSGALLTSHLNPLQIVILIKLGVPIVFALDKGIDIRQDENIQKLRRYVKVQYIYDNENLIEDKMAPVDRGIEVWKNLYERRRSLN